MAAVVQSLTDQMKQAANGVQNSVQKTLGQFSNPAAVAAVPPPAVGGPGGMYRNTLSSLGMGASPGAGAGPSASGSGGISTAFLNSNSMVAKIAFIILVLIVFMALLSLAMSILGYFLQSSTTPYIVYGTLNGFDSKVIPTDPKQPNYVNIQRSNNQATGAEFSYSIWLNMNNHSGSTTKFQHVFNKGDGNFQGGGATVSAVNNAPGFYITTNDSTDSKGQCVGHVVMDTVDPAKPTSIVDIVGLPYNQWVNLVIRLENKMLDIYVNGVITNRVVLPAVPKQNYNDINVCQNGGFSGMLSNLRYYNYALSAFEINALVLGGPNTAVSKMSSSAKTGSPYFLSYNWYNAQHSSTPVSS